MLESEIDDLTQYIKRANDHSKYYIISDTGTDDVTTVTSEDETNPNGYESAQHSGSIVNNISKHSMPKRDIPYKGVFSQNLSASASDTGNWECPACTTRNLKYDNSCLACETPRSLPTVKARWRCPKCTFENSSSNRYCEMCESPKPFYGGASVNFDDVFEKVAFAIITKLLRSKSKKTQKQKKSIKKEKSIKKQKSLKIENKSLKK